jgi:acylphosphatase
MIARRAVVSGSVQGVGFRFFAQRAAREARVTGWVRNRADGTVETVVEGEAEGVDRYLERLRSGPAGGRITSLVLEERLVEGYSSFEITG